MKNSFSIVVKVTCNDNKEKEIYFDHDNLPPYLNFNKIKKISIFNQCESEIYVVYKDNKELLPSFETKIFDIENDFEFIKILKKDSKNTVFWIFLSKNIDFKMKILSLLIELSSSINNKDVEKKTKKELLKKVMDILKIENLHLSKILYSHNLLINNLSFNKERNIILNSSSQTYFKEISLDNERKIVTTLNYNTNENQTILFLDKNISFYIKALLEILNYLNRDFINIGNEEKHTDDSISQSVNDVNRSSNDLKNTTSLLTLMNEFISKIDRLKQSSDLLIKDLEEKGTKLDNYKITTPSFKKISYYFEYFNLLKDSSLFYKRAFIDKIDLEINDERVKASKVFNFICFRCLEKILSKIGFIEEDKLFYENCFKNCSISYKKESTKITIFYFQNTKVFSNDTNKEFKDKYRPTFLLQIFNKNDQLIGLFAIDTYSKTRNDEENESKNFKFYKLKRNISLQYENVNIDRFIYLDFKKTKDINDLTLNGYKELDNLIDELDEILFDDINQFYKEKVLGDDLELLY